GGGPRVRERRERPVASRRGEIRPDAHGAVRGRGRGREVVRRALRASPRGPPRPMSGPPALEGGYRRTTTGMRAILWIGAGFVAVAGLNEYLLSSQTERY